MYTWSLSRLWTEKYKYKCAEWNDKCKFKAYIPLRRKIPGVGGWRWVMPPTPEFCVGDTNILEPTRTFKFALPPTPTPDASQWNIGGVGSQHKILALDIYIYFFCV